MGILNIQVSQAGLVGTLPTPIYINTNDTYATVTATGYLNGAHQLGQAFSDEQMALVYTSNEGPVWLKVVVSGTDYSLVQISSPGDVTLPTIANHLMISSDTAGTLANKTGVAINAGGLQAGLDATAGVLTSFPATTISGVLVVAAADNATGDFDTTISNATAVGQSQVISIPDAGAATAKFILSASTASSQTITSGLIVSGGNVQTNGGDNFLAGADASAGAFFSFPATTASGTLALAAADNATGDFDTTISNGTAIGQDQVISIPDAGAATGNFILSTAAATQSLDAVSFSTTTGIVGTTTNNNAAAGSVGEMISSVIASGSSVSLTTATEANITSITLTAGDWDIWGNLFFTPGATTNLVDALGGISATTVTLPLSDSLMKVNYGAAGVVIGSGGLGHAVPGFRVSLAAGATYYLVGYATFSVSTVVSNGAIYARRVR